MKRLLAAAVIAIPLTAWGQGGPPLLTDDPGTPGDRHWEINIAVTSESSSDALHFETPIADINYGLGERIQLKYEVPLVFSKPAGVGSSVGFEQSIAGVKWRFLDKESAGVAISTYPQITFSTPVPGVMRLSKNVSPATGSQFLLPIELEEDVTLLGHDFELNQEVGYNAVSGAGAWRYGVVVGHEVSQGIMLLWELNGNVATAFTSDDLVTNIGSEIELSKELSLLLSAGRSLREPSGVSVNYLGYLGVQFRL